MHELLTTNELTSNAVKFWSLPFLQNDCDRQYSKCDFNSENLKNNLK